MSPSKEFYTEVFEGKHDNEYEPWTDSLVGESSFACEITNPNKQTLYGLISIGDSGTGRLSIPTFSRGVNEDFSSLVQQNEIIAKHSDNIPEAFKTIGLEMGENIGNFSTSSFGDSRGGGIILWRKPTHLYQVNYNFHPKIMRKSVIGFVRKFEEDLDGWKIKPYKLGADLHETKVTKEELEEKWKRVRFGGRYPCKITTENNEEFFGYFLSNILHIPIKVEKEGYDYDIAKNNEKYKSRATNSGTVEIMKEIGIEMFKDYDSIKPTRYFHNGDVELGFLFRSAHYHLYRTPFEKVVDMSEGFEKNFTGFKIEPVELTR